MLRFLAFVASGFPVAFAVAPADLGVSFAWLGVPVKFAFAIDLTFRFIPSLAADLRTTMDAQRVRGYDWERPAANPIAPAPADGAARRAADDERDRQCRGHDRCNGPAGVRDGPPDVAAPARLRPHRPVILVGLVVLLVTFTILGFVGGTSEIYVFPFLIDLAAR